MSFPKYKHKFKEIGPIGNGAFSTVFEAISLADNKSYAIKKIPFKSEERVQTLEEIRFLKTLSNDFVVKYIDSFVEQNYYIGTTSNTLDQRSLLFDPKKPILLHIQMELCSMTLNEFIVSLNYTQKNSLTLEQFTIACKIFEELLKCVQYLHDHKPQIIHRDLKPENIMISEGSESVRLKIADFGLSTYHSYIDQSHTKYIGTKIYRAPELDNFFYDTKADIYSLGKIMGELFNIDINRLEKVVDQQIISNYEHLIETFMNCLSVIASKRPTCDQILQTKNLWYFTAEERNSELNRQKQEPKVFIKKRVHNVILLGESGVGKSTLINAMANYLSYIQFENAKHKELIIFVGTSVGYVDNNGEFKMIIAVEDDNELIKELGESATQLPKSYKFHLGQDVCVRFIDSPGFNDTRGREQDKENLETIMKIIDACKEISALCLVMKSDHTRMNGTFMYCLNQFFSQLDQRICKNLSFIFTCGKGVNYYPIYTIAMLNKYLRDRNINVRLTQQNTYCFENEPFNYLLAVKHNIKVNFTSLAQSWQISAEQSKKLINNTINLEPYNAKYTVNINKTRYLIEKLTLELSKINEYIVNCLNSIEQNIKEVKISDDFDELKNMKSKPQYVCETVKLEKPKLVCTSRNCTRIDREGNIYYPQVCCPECGVLSHMKGHGRHVRFAPKFIFGKRNCNRCQCLETSHRIIFFETRYVLRNNTESNEISDTLTARSNDFLKTDLLQKLEFEHKTKCDERNAIIKALALFYSYMKRNTIIEFEDIFELQIQAKLDKFAPNCSEFEATKEVLQLYAKEKSFLESQRRDVTIRDLEDTKHRLCALYFNGKNILNIYMQLDSSLDGTEISDEICIDVPFL